MARRPAGKRRVEARHRHSPKSFVRTLAGSSVANAFFQGAGARFVVAHFPEGQSSAGQGFNAREAVPKIDSIKHPIFASYVSNYLSTSTMGCTMYTPKFCSCIIVSRQPIQLSAAPDAERRACHSPRLDATDRTLQPRASRACHGRAACKQKQLVKLLLEATEKTHSVSEDYVPYDGKRLMEETPTFSTCRIVEEAISRGPLKWPFQYSWSHF